MSDTLKPSASRAKGATTRTNTQTGRAIAWVTHISTSGCGACAQSIAGLLAPHYAESLRAQGVTFVRSPRHADVVLLTGALTIQARKAIDRVLATIPEPCALIAVGDCAIDGCVFAGSDALAESLAEQLDVNVEIAGCPPSPSAILAAIVEAKRLLAGAENDANSATSTTVTDTAQTAEENETTDETLAELVEATGGDSDPGDDDEETEA